MRALPKTDCDMAKRCSGWLLGSAIIDPVHYLFATLLACSLSVAALAQDSSLKLHLDFDHVAADGTVLDQSGNAAHGIQFNRTNLISSTNGVFGSLAGWFRYVGTMTNDPPNTYPLSQYLAVTNIQGFHYLTNGTISFWAQFGRNNDVGMHVLDTGYTPQYTPNPSLASNSWTIGRSIDPFLSFTIYPSSGAQTLVTWPTDVVNASGPTRDLSTVAFHLYSVTFDCTAGTAISYYDGKPYRTNSFSLPWLRIYGGSNKRWLCIGAMAHTGSPEWGDDRYPNSGFFVGRLDEIRIYNRTLSAGEIASLYYGGDNVVTVSATDAVAGESGTGLGGATVAFSRSGPADTALTANLSLSGTATRGSDYTMATTVSFEAGSNLATRSLSVLEDALAEGDETVTISVAPGTGYTVASPASTTITIEDDDVPGPEVILDNASSTGVSYSGTWTSSTVNPDYWGWNYYHDGNTGKGSKSVRFTPNLPSAGTYQVYIWYPARVDYASGVPVDVLHADGTTTVTVDQKVNGGMWNLLGTFSFNAGTGGYARIRTTGTSGYVIADAVRFVRGGITSPQVTVRAIDAVAGEPGTGAGTGLFEFSRTGSTDSTLTVNFSTGGTATSGSDFAPLGSTVTFPIGSSIATRLVEVYNDTTTEADESVTLTVTSGAGYVVASPASASITIQDDEPSIAELILDNAASSGVVYSGTWTASTTTPGYWAANYRHDGNAAKASKSVTFTPNFPSAGVYEVYLWYPSRSDYAANVPVDIVHAGGTTTLAVNQRVNGRTWNLLGAFNFNAGTSGYLRIRTTGTTAYVVADAVKFVSGGTVLPQVTVAAVDATAGEPGTGQGNAVFEFTRTGPLDSPLTVNLSISGTAIGGEDYAPLTSSVTFEVGSVTATTILLVNDDAVGEGDETVTLTLIAGAGYTLGSPGTATATIKDDDAFASEVIVDNASSSVKYDWSWSTSSSTPGYYAANYRHDGNTSKGSKSATFTPNLAAAGSYQVYIWYPARSDYAGNVPVDIAHAGGITSVTVSQKANGNRWNLLGTYDFNAGTSGYARIRTTGTTGYVVADAFKWVSTPSPSPAPQPTRLLARAGAKAPQVQIHPGAAGELLLEWTAAPGIRYRIQSSSDAGETWTTVHETLGHGADLQQWSVVPAENSEWFRVEAF